MRLKKIELKGFKSFADKTILWFDLGMTAIVGPNGCGKSNVADAFRWVMGEQSARSLRGNKMPDVIFAGTTLRKPQNFAEVTITLTEVAGKLPIDYDEVAVTRRLNRSGESEYLINNQTVRLKDVQDLLLDSGIGNDSYAIFEQGKIDEVIKLPPMERRYIFEEAAGIKRFLQRKKEALRRLEQTKGNVDRVRDLHGEIQRQVSVLEKQAEEAKEYKEKKIELEKLEKALLAEKWFDWDHKKKGLQQKIDMIDGSLGDLTGKSESFQIQILEAKQQLLESEKLFREHCEAVFRLRSAKDVHGKENENCEARLEELQQKEQRWNKELTHLQQRRQGWQGEKEAVATQLKIVEQHQIERDQELEKQSQHVEHADEALKKLRIELQFHQNELLAATKKLQAAQGELKQQEIRIENSKEREKYLGNRKQQLLEQKKDDEALSKECQANFDTLLRSVEENKVNLSRLEGQLTDTIVQLDEVESQSEKRIKDLTDSKARYKALKSLQDDMEGFSKGTQLLLAESGKKESPLYGKVEPLYNYFVVKKGAEKAITAAMTAYGQTLVVKTQEDFIRVVEFAKSKGIIDFSILCLATLPPTKKGRSKKETLHILDYVDDNLLTQHFLSQLSLIQPETFLQNPTETCVGFDGVFTDHNQVTFFPKVEGASIFLRESEIKELERSIISMEKDRDQLEQVVKSLQVKRKELQGAIITSDKAIRQLEIKSAELNISLQKYRTDQGRIDSEATKISGEMDVTVGDIKTLLQSQATTSALVEEMKIEVAKVQKNVDLASVKYEEMTAEAKKQHALLKHIEGAWQKNLDEKRKHLHAINVIEGRESESQQQQKRIEDELEMGRILQKQLSQKKEELFSTLIGDDNALNSGMAAQKKTEDIVNKRKQEIATIQAKVDNLAKELKKQQELKHQVLVQIAQVEVQMQTVIEELHQKHAMNLETLMKLQRIETASFENLEAKVKQLRKDVENAKSINMTSIEEYERCQARHKEIAGQLEDMGLAEQELLDIIAGLDAESRTLFQATFEKIRENFQKNFSILFTGGEADLQFVDSKDILEAGIEIVAKPPGKQMRSIQLLSGGEKCLTALALLFAIFEVKPAPFCILDEIDAPLDDSNVDRFVNIVKKFSEVCQFIIITHNKRTMMIADKIFGVSMEEKGVSKLLAIDLSTYQEEKTRKEPEFAEF